MNQAFYKLLENKNVEFLENGITLIGDINLENAVDVEMPTNLTVIGDLNLSNAKIKSFPTRLVVSGNLILRGSNITTLPDNLYVAKNLILWYSAITELPRNLHVGGNIGLTGTNISDIPTDLSIGGNITMADKIITKIGVIHKKQHLKTHQEEKLTNIVTGYSSINDMLKLCECKRGSLIAIGGSPSIGKTTFLLNLIHNIPLSNVVYSFKLTRSMFIKRMNLIFGSFDNNLNIVGSPYTSITDIEKFIKNYKPAYVFIDRINRLNCSNHTLEYSMRKLKRIGNECNTTIFVTTDISRKALDRDNHIPITIDIPEPIVNYSDLIMFLHRDNYYCESDKNNILEVVFPTMDTTVTLKYDDTWKIYDAYSPDGIW